ncbi:SURF1 family protein [Collimonas pratensis]|uniref:SURF1-like protein n=1 Tax=Collimonas pratensis TaxID=279113 RepID=A0A127PYZ2_9BURK|nr:SURF1 family protein [Collimonas pratensis]AMP03040.1 SURF1 family protein [Collimonas pratensis]
MRNHSIPGFRSFRFRLIPFIATVLLVALGIGLGQWQTWRGDQKQLIENKLRQRQTAPLLRFSGAPADLDQLEYRRLALRGEFIGGWPVYLDNRPLNGVAGFYVLMPFKLADSGAGSDNYVLVARGWLPRDPSDRSKLPPYPTPAGTVEIEGLVRRDFGHVMQLGDAGPLQPGAIVQNLAIGEFAAASKFKLQPFVVEQTSAAGDQLQRTWPSPSLGIERHRGYAFQWYALAVMAFIFFVVTGFRRGSENTNKPAAQQSG